MIKVLRAYQQDIVNDIKRLLKESDDPILVDASVGSGKSLILSTILLMIERAGFRALCLTLNSTLIKQNADTYNLQGGDCGIYCAGLNSKEFEKSVIFASPHSVCKGIYKKEQISRQPFQLVVIDEVHNVDPFSADSMYMRILNHYSMMAQTEQYKFKVIGLTGTPYRGKGESIVGPAGLFKTKACEISTSWLIQQGFLTKPYFGLPQVDSFDFSQLRVKNTGKFDQKQLAQIVDENERLTGEIMREITRVVENGRKGAFIFASTRKHCLECVKSLPEGQHAIITGETPHELRSIILEKARNGTIKYLVNVNCLTVGVDITSFDVCAWLRPTESLVLYTQGIGRVLRLHPGKTNCISEGSLVLTHRGLVPIEKVLYSDRLWDGLNWVKHDGIIYKGEQETIEYCGLIATEDHKIWTKEGWRTIGHCSEKQIPIARTEYNGKAIREGEDYITRKSLARERQSKTCFRRMYGLQRKKMDNDVQSLFWKNTRLQKVWKSSSSTKMAVFKNARSRASLQKSKQQNVQKLRWKRNTVPIQKPTGGIYLCQKSLRARQNETNRSNRQRWSLRAWEFKAFNKYPKCIPYEKNNLCSCISCIQNSSSGNKIRRQHSSSFIFNGPELRSNNRKILSSFFQTKRKVWDIQNSGPFHRFTVSGILVHNCIVLDYAGNLQRHGDIDDPIINEALQPREENEKDYCIPCYTCGTNNTIHARRCIGRSGIGDNSKRCDHYFEFKPCHLCSVQNDITSRHCRSCDAELIDPNSKLNRNNQTITVAIVKGEYWVTAMKGGFPIINCRYYAASGWNYTELFYTNTDKSRNICYAKFCRQHISGPSEYYMKLSDYRIMLGMIERGVKTPHSIVVINNADGSYKLVKKLFD